MNSVRKMSLTESSSTLIKLRDVEISIPLSTHTCHHCQIDKLSPAQRQTCDTLAVEISEIYDWSIDLHLGQIHDAAPVFIARSLHDVSIAMMVLGWIRPRLNAIHWPSLPLGAHAAEDVRMVLDLDGRARVFPTARR